MKAVIETATGKALYLFDDGETVTITGEGMIEPLRALDLRPDTHSVVTATNPAFFVGGGVMSWNGSWYILDQVAYDAAVAAAIVPPPSPVGEPPQIKACALRVNVTDDEVSGLSGCYNILAISKVDFGTFWCMLVNPVDGPQPELVPNNGIHIGITAWSSTDFFIECREHAGAALIDPASFGFTLYQFS